VWTSIVVSRNKQGQSALDIMIRKESPSIEFIQLLLSAGIDLQSHNDLLEHINDRLNVFLFDMFDTPSANHTKAAAQHVLMTRL